MKLTNIVQRHKSCSHHHSQAERRGYQHTFHQGYNHFCNSTSYHQFVHMLCMKVEGRLQWLVKWFASWYLWTWYAMIEETRRKCYTTLNNLVCILYIRYDMIYRRYEERISHHQTGPTLWLMIDDWNLLFVLNIFLVHVAPQKSQNVRVNWQWCL